MWIPLIIYLFIQCITPGPNDLTCLFLGGEYGLKGTRQFLIGSMGMLLIKSVVCGAMNLVLARVMPSVVNVLKWLGAAYMLYLAYIMALSGWKEEISLKGQQKKSSIASGVILQLLNAKSWIAGISMFAVYVIPYRQDFSSVIISSFIYMIIALFCSLVWALFGYSIKGIIARHKKTFGIVMGLTQVCCAVSAVL